MSPPNTPGPDGAPPEHPARAAARIGADVAARLAARARAGALASAKDGLRKVRTAGAWLWARRPPARVAVAAAFVAGAAAISIASILAQAGLPRRLPSPLDWEGVRALLARDGRRGDAVALAPEWAERARELAPGAVAVLAQRRYAGEDLVGVRRLWLLSLPDAPRFSWNVELDLLERASQAQPPVRLGAVEVRRFDLAFPTLPLAFVPDALAQADVTQGDTACATSAGAVECPQVRVAREEREVDGAARPCLAVSFQGTPDAPLVLNFPGLRLGRVVHGHAGPVAGGSGAVPVRVAVQVDGEEIGATELRGPRFSSFAFDTTRHAGQARSLSLVVTPDGAPGTICLDAVTMP